MSIMLPLVITVVSGYFVLYFIEFTVYGIHDSPFNPPLFSIDNVFEQ